MYSPGTRVLVGGYGPTPSDYGVIVEAVRDQSGNNGYIVALDNYGQQAVLASAILPTPIAPSRAPNPRGVLLYSEENTADAGKPVYYQRRKASNSEVLSAFKGREIIWDMGKRGYVYANNGKYVGGSQKKAKNYATVKKTLKLTNKKEKQVRAALREAEQVDLTRPEMRRIRKAAPELFGVAPAKAPKAKTKSKGKQAKADGSGERASAVLGVLAEMREAGIDYPQVRIIARITGYTHKQVRQAAKMMGLPTVKGQGPEFINLERANLYAPAIDEQVQPLRTKKKSTKKSTSKSTKKKSTKKSTKKKSTKKSTKKKSTSKSTKKSTSKSTTKDAKAKGAEIIADAATSPYVSAEAVDAGAQTLQAITSSKKIKAADKAAVVSEVLPEVIESANEAVAEATGGDPMGGDAEQAAIMAAFAKAVSGLSK